MDRDIPTCLLSALTVTTLLRSNASIAWLVLVTLTVIAWALGTHRPGATHETISLVIIAVAMFKVRLVGLYFMELRQAPWSLRGMFEGYCAITVLLLSGMFLLT
jgi:caa(3)-type oxidase subunit IV